VVSAGVLTVIGQLSFAVADGASGMNDINHQEHAKMAGVHRVAVLLLPPVVGFDATIPPMLLGTAADDEGNPLYEVVVCGLSAAPVSGTNGFDVVPAAGPEALATADTVIVPGTRYRPARVDGVLAPDARAAFDAIRPGTRMVSICTGAFVLAAAGLLDGRPATTHWKFAADLTRLHPRVHVDENVLFVDDGDVLTSAGLAAGIDLCLHIIRSDHGTQVANAVARYCVVPPWREGGQAQFIDRHVPVDDTASTAATREWALRHLDEDLTVDRLARHAHMSPRTFNRRFREETGQAPGTWIRNRRVDRARELLESRDLPVDEVARLSGLGSGGNLRHHLRRGVGMSPSSYRKVFQGS
jgi:transcriptional regulator GlxA family with amidase domain